MCLLLWRSYKRGIVLVLRRCQYNHHFKNDLYLRVMSTQKQDLLARIKTHHSEHEKLVEDCMSQVGIDPEVFYQKSFPQSMCFMLELIPLIHKLYIGAPTNITKTVLDVGPQTYGGTALLERMHRQESFNNLKLEVSSIDIHDKFDLVRELECPNVEFIKNNIFNVKGRVWDTIICSHVIEHVDDPIKFLNRLRKLCSDFVVVTAPWREYPIETAGHVNTIDKSTLLGKLPVRDLSIATNYMWGKRREVVTFVLDGLA